MAATDTLLSEGETLSASYCACVHSLHHGASTDARRTMKAVVLLLSLLWSLVEIHSQTVPYVSFMGDTLRNHAYVDLTQVGKNDSDTGSVVRCHTDLSACCNSTDGPHRGEWYFPDGSEVQVSVSGDDIYVRHGSQQVNLHRRNNTSSPSGIYRCDIATIAVHNDSDLSVRDTVYVGLYASGGILV